MSLRPTRYIYSINVQINDWFNGRYAELVEVIETGGRELRLDMAARSCTEKSPPMKCEICQRRLDEGVALLEDNQRPYRVDGKPAQFIVLEYPAGLEAKADQILLFLAEMLVGWRFCRDYHR